MKIQSILFLFLLFAFACSEPAADKETGLSYPPTKKVDHIDNYHGTEISDPYHWLENDTSKETADWVRAQNELTFSYLDKIPYRSKIRARLNELVNYPRQSAPNRAGNYYFYSKNDGLQNQDVIYVKEGLSGEEEVFIDPNSFSEDGTVTFNIAEFSDDHTLVVVSKSEAGSDWSQLITYDIKTKQSTGDTLNWIKFGGASWYKDGYFYSRYPAPKKGEDYSASNSFHTVYYHKHGASQSEDPIIFEDQENPNRYHWVSISEDKEYIFLYVSTGTNGYECYFKKTSINPTGFKALFTGFEHKSSVIDHIDGRFLVRTDIGAPNYRLVSVDPNNPEEENWIEIIPENKNLLQGANTAGGVLFARYLENAQGKVYRMNLKGENAEEIVMPAAGSISGFWGEREDTLLFYGFSSFTNPGRTYSYNVRTKESAIYYEPELKFNPDDFESKQVFYPSKDGTKISMFIVYKKGVKLDGSAPCLLYGYGGFNISLTPSFSTSRIPWLEGGGIYAMANLRGGGEYGEEWHKAGMLLNKQNVFDDFIAAGEYLISEKYTSSEKLVISGRSNGGLLVGAVMTQRPDLMKVALPGVGVMDMLRYHDFTVGHGWIPEYGSSDDEEHFKNLLSYSPLHNLKEGVSYPATMVYTGDHDDRVVPAHSFKFAATLQECNAGTNPCLIRIETQAGHGSGKPMSKTLDEVADWWAFSFYNVGHNPY